MEGANEGKTPALSDDQARALLDIPPHDTLKGKRDRAILAVFLYHGLRCSELVGLPLCIVEVSGFARTDIHHEVKPLPVSMTCSTWWAGRRVRPRMPAGTRCAAYCNCRAWTVTESSTWCGLPSQLPTSSHRH